MTKPQAPLWTCPKCGVKLVTRNLWHSCGRATIADWRARMGPHARTLYDRFEQMIGACGEYSYRLMGRQERLRTRHHPSPRRPARRRPPAG